MITRWKVSNFKSIREQVDLSFAPLTIFAGPNSSGKSTLIASLLVVSQTMTSSIEQETIVLNGHYIRLGNFEDVLHYGTEKRPMELGFTLQLSEKTVGFETVIQGVKPQKSFIANRLYPQVQRSIVHISDNVEDDNHEAITLETGDDSQEAKTPETGDDGQDAILEVVRREEKLNLNTKEEQDFNAVLKFDDGKPIFNYQITHPLSNELTLRPTTEEVIACSLHGILPNRMLLRTKIAFNQYREEIQQLTDAIVNKYIDSNQILGLPSKQALLRVYNTTRAGWFRQNKRLKEFFNDTIDPTTKITLGEFVETLTKIIGVNPGDLKDLSKRLLGTLVDFEKMLPSNEIETGLESRFFPLQYSKSLDQLNRLLGHYVYYLGPLRDDPKVIYAIPPTTVQKYVGVKGEYCAAILDTYKDFKISYPLPPENPVESFKGVYDSTKGTLAEAVQAWVQRMGLAQDIETAETAKVGYQLNIRAPGSEKLFDLMSVGVGVSQVLPILVMGLLAPDHSILVFEQPEVHLHPKMQSVLADFFLSLTMLGKQCIVETHSVYLINRLRLRIAQSNGDDLLKQSRIYFVEKENSVSQFTPVEPNEYGAIHEWPTGFFDEVEDESRNLIRSAMQKRKQRHQQKKQTDKE